MFNLFTNNNKDLLDKNPISFEEESDYFKIKNDIDNNTDTESDLEQFKNIDISESTKNNQYFNIELDDKKNEEIPMETDTSEIKTENMETDNPNITKYDDYISDDDIEMEDAIYVITINKEPYFYSDNLKIARENLIDISRKLKSSRDEEIFDDFYINEKNKNEIDIIYSYNLTLFSYNHLKYNIKIHPIMKYK